MHLSPTSKLGYLSFKSSTCLNILDLIKLHNIARGKVKDKEHLK